jgi:tetratricopeptide (TPR) repeat protein
MRCGEKSTSAKALSETIGHGYSFLIGGRTREAAECGRRALEVQSGNAKALQLMERIAFREADYTRAANCLQKVVAAGPENPNRLNHLGAALSAAGRQKEAAAFFRRALAAAPGNAAIWINLGLALKGCAVLGEAVQSFKQALLLDPNNPECWLNLGSTLSDMGRHDEAEVIFRQALRLRPNFGKAYNNLGNTLRASGRVHDAIESFRQALRAMPDSIGAMNNLGNALRAAGRFTEAERFYRRALASYPDSAETCCNLGNVQCDDRRYDEALASYNRALQLNPEFAEVHFNRAWIYLLQAQFTEGWKEYAWRLRRPAWIAGAPGRISLPAWHGEPFTGRRLLIYDEQGFGDTIQFARYLPMVKALGGTTIFEARPNLLSLFKSLKGVDRLVARQSIERPATEADAYVPLLSLPRLFRTDLLSIPWHGAYLQADPSAQLRWQGRLGRERFRIGIVWSASQVDPLRVCPAAAFAWLGRFPEVGIYSLQKDAIQTTVANDLPGVVHLGPEFNDFGDTAAVLANLDLIISVDTAVAHLSGAMAKRTWVLLPYAADWRWLEDREDSPWYPTMRLFRQKKWGDWQDVMERVAEAFRHHFGLRVAA